MRNQDLLQRQRALRLRSQQLRQALARDAGALSAPLHRAGSAGSALIRCARGPCLPITALVMLALAWRLGAALGLLRHSWFLWRGWRRWQRWLRS